ncbi:hypothetical protein ABW19_dt0202501 [Dactylella cylindrospora]|nr:hypothetical protein ABW19_dt0202501 [Dactylella cylindrospora]
MDNRDMAAGGLLGDQERSGIPHDCSHHYNHNGYTDCGESGILEDNRESTDCYYKIYSQLFSEETLPQGGGLSQIAEPTLQDAEDMFLQARRTFLQADLIFRQAEGIFQQAEGSSIQAELVFLQVEISFRRVHLKSFPSKRISQKAQLEFLHNILEFLQTDQTFRGQPPTLTLQPSIPGSSTHEMVWYFNFHAYKCSTCRHSLRGQLEYSKLCSTGQTIMGRISKALINELNENYYNLDAEGYREGGHMFIEVGSQRGRPIFQTLLHGHATKYGPAILPRAISTKKGLSKATTEIENRPRFPSEIRESAGQRPSLCEPKAFAYSQCERAKDVADIELNDFVPIAKSGVDPIDTALTTPGESIFANFKHLCQGQQQLEYQSDEISAQTKRIIRNTISETALEIGGDLRHSSLDYKSPRSAAIIETIRCTICSKKFLHAKDFRRHEDTIHKNPKNYPCPETNCSKSRPGNGFSRRDNLQKHMKTIHAKTLSPLSVNQGLFIQHNGIDLSQQDQYASRVRADTSTDIHIPHLIDYSSNPASGVSIPHNSGTSPDWSGSEQEISEEESTILFGDEAVLRGLQALHQLQKFCKPKDLSQHLFSTLQTKHCQREEQTRKRMLISLQSRLRTASSPDVTLSRERMLTKYHKFRQKADEVYQKLQEVSKSPSKKRETRLNHFIYSELRSIENVITSGFHVLSDLIDHKKKKLPKGLSSLYCLLIVCYAMSQASDVGNAIITDEQFGKEIPQWKACLSAATGPEVSTPDQDLFDELIEVLCPGVGKGMQLVDFSTLIDASSNLDAGFDANGIFYIYDPDSDLPSSLDTGALGLNSDLANFDLDSFEVPTLAQNFTKSVPPGSTDLQVHPWEPPSWDSLMGSAFISAATNFTQELRATGIVFLFMCGNIAVSTLRRSKELPPLRSKPLPGIDLNQRQDILTFFRDCLDQKLSTVLNAVSAFFLDGIIDTLNDLEECMVAFLKIQTMKSHSFMCHFSAITTHFYRYYHEHLPCNLKCFEDPYSSRSYISERQKYEETLLSYYIEPNPTQIYCDLISLNDADVSERTGRNSSWPGGSRAPNLGDEGDIEKRDANVAGIASRQTKDAMSISSPPRKEFKFRNITGEPRKRKQVLKRLPRAGM